MSANSGCPCAEPPSLERLVALEAELEPECICAPWCTPPDRDQPFAQLLTPCVVALCDAVRLGVQVHRVGLSDRKEERDRKQVVDVLESLVEAYRLERNEVGRARVEAELDEVRSRARRRVSVDAMVNWAALAEQLSLRSPDPRCCRALEVLEAGPVRVVTQVDRRGDLTADVCMVAGAGGGTLIVGPVTVAFGPILTADEQSLAEAVEPARNVVRPGESS